MITMTQGELKSRVDGGETMVAPSADATLHREGATYVMGGPQGEHRLFVEATDAGRLAAHWHGFLRASSEFLGIKADA
jgi:hypothetical protein